MTWHDDISANLLPTRTALVDLDAAADINELTDLVSDLWDDVQALGGNGTSQPSSDIETLNGDIEDLDDRINSLESGFTQIRQTILSSSVDANNLPNFLAAGAALNDFGLTASAGSPVVASFANGFGSPSDYRELIESNQTFAALIANAVNFLYIDRAAGGTLSFASSLYQPMYSYLFRGNYIGALHHGFEGANGAAVGNDSYSNVLTFGSTAPTISTTQYKFGSTSMRISNAANCWAAYACPDISRAWCQEFWFRLDGVAANQYLAGSSSTYGCIISMLTATKKLYLSLSSNGSSWNIANAQIGTTVLSATTWYRVVLQWDGATYKLWLDDGANVTLECSVASSSAMYRGATGQNWMLGNHGAGSSTGMVGYIDSFRWTPYIRYTGTPTVQASAWTLDTLCWFNLNTFKMYTGNPTDGWTQCWRIFVGEAVTGAATVSSTVIYALRGRYDSGWFAVAAGNYSKSHNIGLPMHHGLDAVFYYSPDSAGVDSALAHDVFSSTYNYGHYMIQNIASLTRNTIYFGFATYTQFFRATGETAGYYRIIIRRVW